MAPPNREGGGGLSLQTLVIASVASVTAAMVTSRLFPPGTIYASALTPIIVAAVNEYAHRPVKRVAELRERRRTMVLEPSRAMGEEANPPSGAPGFALGAAADDEGLGSANGGGNGHRSVPGSDPFGLYGRPRRRLINPRVVIATGLAGFAIAAAVLTVPELLFGGAVASNHQTTFFGGGGSHHATTQQKTTTTKTTTTTTTTTAPAQTPAQSNTTTTPTDTTTGTTTTPPSGGAPAPTDTTTATQTTPPPTGAPPQP